jgi:DNA-binding GntR family transcriptional regulator
MPAAAPLESPMTSSSASKQKVVHGMLCGLMRGEWTGNERLTESAAVDLFGVSRTPVREAFLELQGLGLLELRRNCGAILLPLGPDELRDLYDVRSLLEVEAARLAAKRIPAVEVSRLTGVFTEIHEAGGTDPKWTHDRELHRLIAEHSGNPRLAAEIARYGELVQAMRMIVGASTFGIHSTSSAEHLAILEALSKKSSNRAANAMQAHLQQAADSAVAALIKLRN